MNKAFLQSTYRKQNFCIEWSPHVKSVGIPFKRRKYINNAITLIAAWFLYQMVAHNTLRTHDVKRPIFREKKLGFDHSFHVTKCLHHIEIPDLLYVCAQVNEQPSNIKTVRQIRFFFEKDIFYIIRVQYVLSYHLIMPR